MTEFNEEPKGCLAAIFGLCGTTNRPMNPFLADWAASAHLSELAH